MDKLYVFQCTLVKDWPTWKGFLAHTLAIKDYKMIHFSCTWGAYFLHDKNNSNLLC